MLAHLCRLPRLSPSAGRRMASNATRTRSSKVKSVSETKSEAKVHGLGAKGDKLSFIASLERDHSSTVLKGKTPGARRASTVPSSTPEPESGIPGNPDLPSIPSVSYLDVKIPDLSLQTDPLSPVQVPYVPDFWDSSNTVPEPETIETPKMVVVAGAVTHYGGGPSHSLVDVHESTESAEPTKVQRSDSLLDDITEDLGLPPVEEIKKSIWKIFS